MEQQKINLNVDPDKIDARYCDQALLNVGPFGFIFDFMQQIPQMQTTRVLARIAMSPQHAKIFSEILSKNVSNYESNFGEIKLSTQLKDEAEKRIGFRPEENKTK